MTIERSVHILAGAFVLLGLALGADASPIFLTRNALWLSLFVGAMLFQSGFTGFCPAGLILRKLGVRSASAPSP